VVSEAKGRSFTSCLVANGLVGHAERRSECAKKLAMAMITVTGPFLLEFGRSGPPSAVKYLTNCLLN
jgi:hypothetical protein